MSEFEEFLKARGVIADPRIDQLVADVAAIKSAVTQIGVKMAQIDDEIAQLVADVAAEKTVEESAVALLNGIPAQIQTAVAAAVAAGATPAQVQSLTDLHTAITAQSSELAAAVTANSPAPTGTAASTGTVTSA